jgi:predicted nucleic-acid-binding protein
VIIRFLIGDDPSKAARATELMARVESAKEIVEIPESVVTETVWTLESYYKVPRAETAQNLGKLLCFPGVRVESRDVFLQALYHYSNTSADFVDCMLAARSQHEKLPVYTFDETDFKKLGVDWQAP